MPTLYAIVPLFNEEPNVDSVAEGLQRLAAAISSQFTLRVLFVDDGSTDDTVGRLRHHEGRLPLEILQLASNSGPGAAFARGFSSLEGRLREDDWVLTMEGDSTSSPDLVQQMLTRRLEGYDVVLGSPYLYGGGFSTVSPVRVFVSQVANGLVRLRLGIRGIFTFSGFVRIYRGKSVVRLQERFGPGLVAMDGFESMVELLGKIVLLDLRVSEVPMRVDGSTRKGRSKMRVGRTIAGYCRLFLRWGTLSRQVASR